MMVMVWWRQRWRWRHVTFKVVHRCGTNDTKRQSNAVVNTINKYFCSTKINIHIIIQITTTINANICTYRYTYVHRYIALTLVIRGLRLQSHRQHFGGTPTWLPSFIIPFVFIVQQAPPQQCFPWVVASSLSHSLTHSPNLVHQFDVLADSHMYIVYAGWWAGSYDYEQQQW